MTKLLNDPFRAVDEMVEGVGTVLGARVTTTPSGRGLVFTGTAPERRAGVILGGGSGHEPAFFGYLGRGLADGVAIGNVFASPAAAPAVEVARAVDRGEGVLFLYGNYEGDIMNFGLASELLADAGIRAETVLVTDDVVSAPVPEQRRGVAGDAVVFKAAGARADEGGSLDDVVAAARHANDRTRTVGVGVAPCTVPTAARPTFTLADGEIDIGMGVHGEPGIRRTKFESADAVVDELLSVLLADRPPAPDESLLVLVNTLGATPAMEGYVLLRRVAARLRDGGVRMHRALVGEYVTSLEMAGASLTLVHLDDELRRLMDAPSAPVTAPSLSVSPR